MLCVCWRLCSSSSLRRVLVGVLLVFLSESVLSR